VRLIAKAPTLAALAYKTARGLPIVYPRNDLAFAENLLYMMFAVPTEPYQVGTGAGMWLQVGFGSIALLC
jgi:citrate synthase